MTHEVRAEIHSAPRRSVIPVGDNGSVYPQSDFDYEAAIRCLPDPGDLQSFFEDEWLGETAGPTVNLQPASEPSRAGQRSVGGPQHPAASSPPETSRPGPSVKRAGNSETQPPQKKKSKSGAKPPRATGTRPAQNPRNRAPQPVRPPGSTGVQPLAVPERQSSAGAPPRRENPTTLRTDSGES
ncbi:synapsin-1-like isoform X3 [Acanthochromis polyacanthus]|uniref:synapsin-1-like isoform X3 n=1 Tax=Acanthochromis polyacanthus TaxID=80966 RepID=UPI002234830F|nr:synapsin-1-like isoform X3 [Acanthochromis polyacanthus]